MQMRRESSQSSHWLACVRVRDGCLSDDNPAGGDVVQPRALGVEVILGGVRDAQGDSPAKAGIPNLFGVL